MTLQAGRGAAGSAAMLHPALARASTAVTASTLATKEMPLKDKSQRELSPEVPDAPAMTAEEVTTTGLAKWRVFMKILPKKRNPYRLAQHSTG